MWCTTCRQEVPGLPAPGGTGFCCAKCHELIPLDSATISSPTVAEPAATVASAPATESAPLDSTLPEYWAWQVNQQLRHAEQLVQSGRRRQLPTGQQLRIDEPSRTNSVEEPIAAETSAPDESAMTTFAWFVICAGVTALTCGSVLMALSFYQERPELWQLGLPIMIIGQVALVLGMGLQLVARTQAEEAASAKSSSAPGSTRPANREINRSTHER